MASVRAFLLGASIVAGQTAIGLGQTPLFPMAQEPKTSVKNPLTLLPGAAPEPMPKTPPVWRPDPPEQPPDAPHLQLIPDWYPVPPPANYTTSSCNFNVWCGPELFSPDYRTYQILMGGFTTRPGFGPRVPNITYVPITLRCSWMLNAPQDTEAFYRGNYELLFDFTLAGITSGIGNALAGPSLIWRYNFVQPNAGVVPYLQAGGGFILTDAHRDRRQRAIGQAFEFNFRTDVGVRCFITEHWTLDCEIGVQHISNGRMAGRNYGINPVGAQIGFTYFFPSGGR